MKPRPTPAAFALGTLFALATLVLAAPLAAPAAAQPGPDRAWSGTVRVSGDWLTGDPSFQEVIEGTVRFDYVRTDPSASEEYAPVEASLTWSIAGTTPDGCAVSGGPLQIPFAPSDDEWGELWVHADGLYEGHLYIAPSRLAGAVTVACPDQEPYQTNGFLMTAFRTGFNWFYVREEGTLMEEAYTANGESGLQTIQWRLTNWVPEVELEVEPVAYEDWVPAAGKTESEPGNDLAVRARLVYQDGTPADEPAMAFTFDLLDVSEEPGVAMNWPITGGATTPDLAFEPARNAGHTITANGQRLEAQHGREATATVSSFDWGAWGDLRVTALMADGRTLTGYLRGDRDRTLIPLPKRQPTSRIADAWKRLYGATGLADDADAENRPAGDDHEGDGLTLYQEYRGFIENGRHVSADPRRKDLFVFDEVGGVSKRAIRMFAAATGLEVHHEFVAGEYDGSRVVNRNVGQGAHLADQHGVRMVAVGGGRDYAVAQSVDPSDTRPSTPRLVRAVEVPRQLMPGGTAWRAADAETRARMEAYMASTTAHELGHAVAIVHHGETDRKGVEWFVPRNALGLLARDENFDLQILETGTGEIRVHTEDGVRRVPRVLQNGDALEVGQVGVPGGQHSGSDRCFMRYDNADAYAGASDPRVRYWAYTEPVGTTLCDSPAGTGVNDPGRQPQSRYGAATRGGCKHQVCVNDRHSHQR